MSPEQVGYRSFLSFAIPLARTASRAGRSRCDLRDPGRRVVQVRVHDGDLRRALERPRPGQALEEQAPERVDVDPAVEISPLELLGGGVVRRTEEHAGTRDPDRTRHLRDAEVGEIDMAEP